MRVDCQTHVFPAGYAEVLAGNPEWPRTVIEGGRYILTYGDAQTFVMEAEAYSIERKLRDMDSARVDVSAISVNMPGPERTWPRSWPCPPPAPPTTPWPRPPPGIRTASSVSRACPGRARRTPWRSWSAPSSPSATGG